MIIVIQRVLYARVVVRGKEEAAIGKGLLLLAGFAHSDSEETVQRAVDKILKMRIFENNAGKMNYSAQDVEAEILFVPNFTLCADTQKGNRPGFAGAAPPEEAEKLFTKMAEYFNEKAAVQTGIFGAQMDVELLNDGPVTFTLEIE